MCIGELGVRTPCVPGAGRSDVSDVGRTFQRKGRMGSVYSIPARLSSRSTEMTPARVSASSPPPHLTMGSSVFTLFILLNSHLRKEHPLHLEAQTEPRNYSRTFFLSHSPSTPSAHPTYLLSKHPESEHFLQPLPLVKSSISFALTSRIAS